MSKLLVIDDNEANRAYIAVLGAVLGCDVIQAASETEALRCVSQADAALVDLHVPGCEPGALLDRLRAVRPQLVVALYTATERGPLLEDFMAIHAITYLLPKPCEPERALQILRSVLSQSADAAPVPN